MPKEINRDPCPAMIAELCWCIRQGWDEREEKRRRGVDPDKPFEIPRLKSRGCEPHSDG